MLLSSLLAAQEAVSRPAPPARFRGWDDLRDADFQFDPDVRAIQGYSVRAGVSVRAALDKAETALAAGAPAAAAEALRQIVREGGGQVIQVGGHDGRWVGAAEWALHLLATRIPAEQLAGLDDPAALAAVERASQWHDLRGLRSLAWSHEGLRAGLGALEQFARLQAERGADAAAVAAATRALELGAGAGMRQLVGQLAPEPPSAAAAAAPALPQDLSDDWIQPLTVELLTRGSRSLHNPFRDTPLIREAPLAPVLPVVDGHVVYVADSISLSAFDLVSGRVLWHHEGPLEEIARRGLRNRWFDFSVYAQRRRRRAISPVQLAQPVLAGQLLLGTVQAREAVHDLDEFEGYPINHPLPRRRLVALDRDTGAVVWSQEREDQPADAFVNEFDVAGPPAVGGGAVFIAGSVTEGAIAAYLAAFDLETGELLWRTPLCTGQQELTMFNRPFQEHVLSPPLFDGTCVYVSTNLGIVAAVDAWSGRVRWLTGYESIPRVGASQMSPEAVSREVWWLNREPFVEAGVLFVAPLDSRWLLALDPADGRVLRLLPANSSRSLREQPVRHQVLPTGTGQVLLVSGTGLERIDARSGQVLLAHTPFGDSPRVQMELSVCGAALLHGGTLYVPCQELLVGVDPESGEVTELHSWGAGGNFPAQRLVPTLVGLVLSDGELVRGAVDLDVVAAEPGRLADGALGERLVLAELALAEGRADLAWEGFDDIVRSVAVAGARPTGGPDAMRALALDRHARSGRLQAALLSAEDSSDTEAWRAVLVAADACGQLFEYAPPALEALDMAGDEREVSRWLGRLVQLDPQRRIEMDADGSQPVELLDLCRRVPLVPPAEQLAILHRLLLEGPEARWQGASARETARRRIDDLLQVHGRELYAEYEQRAVDDLARGLPVSAVELRYPNALAVGRAHAESLSALIDGGQVREAFEAAALLEGGDELLALRVRAARALGEDEFADVLEGRSAPRPPAQRSARLPVDGSDSFVVDLDPDLDVAFPPFVSGTPAAAFAGCALGALDNRRPQLFLLDSATGELRWRGRSLPGKATSLETGVSFHFEGELLVTRNQDTLEVSQLADGRPVWLRTLHDVSWSLVTAGLVLAIDRPSTGALRLEGFGLRSGARAFSLPLPDVDDVDDMRMVGPWLVVQGRDHDPAGRQRGRSLLVLDVVHGAVRSSTPLDEALNVVGSTEEPPVLLLSARSDADRPARLVAFLPEQGGLGWEAVVPVRSVSARDNLVPSVGGHFLLLEPVKLPDRQQVADRLHLVDSRQGLLEPLDELPRFDVLKPEGAMRVATLFLIDPVGRQQACVVDGATGALRYMLDFEQPLAGYNRVLQGEDGFVLVAEAPTHVEPASTSVWIVRGEDGASRYSTALPESQGARVLLVDGAVLLAFGGSVHVIRGEGSR